MGCTEFVSVLGALGHGTGRPRLLALAPSEWFSVQSSRDEPLSIQSSGQVVPLTHLHTCEAGVTIWSEGRSPPDTGVHTAWRLARGTHLIMHGCCK